MNTIIELYKAQLRILWTWQGGPLALLGRFVLTIVVSAIAFLGTAWIIPGVTVDGFAAALGAVILVTLFNAVIRSVLLALVAPYSLLLTGILVLVLQIFAFLVVAQ